MSTSGTNALAKASPAARAADTTIDTTQLKKPQEAGWAERQAYDYETYNKSTKELSDADAAAGDAANGAWASDAVKYEWKDEFGDVGERLPELEEILFGGEHRSRSGIDFSQ